MAYIGNSRSLIIVGTNVRDDIIPGHKPGTDTSLPFDQDEFELSQEVPGGYEANVTVLRQKYIVDQLLSESDNLVTITYPSVVNSVRTNKISISSNNSGVASALSVVRPGDILVIQILSAQFEDYSGSGEVDSVVYSGTSITIELKISAEFYSNQNQVAVTEDIVLFRGIKDNWEVLDPENDYEIVGTGDKVNRIIRLKEIPQKNDKIYVVHQGEATYNFVPSPKSVGPDQLSENLRNFVVDRHTVASPTIGPFLLSQEAVSPNSLLVSVNGIIQDSLIDGVSVSLTEYPWSLNSSGTSITFSSALPIGTKIVIKHLGFSTISRRAKFALGQETNLPDNSVSEQKIQSDAVSESKIASNAVTTTKIKNNAVTGAKILLDNNEALRSKKSSGSTNTEIIKLGSDNTTKILNETEVSVDINSNKVLSINSTSILPDQTNTVSLGSSTKKLKDVFVAGNITVDGDVDGANISDLKIAINNIVSTINNGNILPIGSIMIWGSNTLPTGWLECDGNSLNTFTYKSLHAAISNTFGGTAFQAGVTDQSGATTTFVLPDLRKRYPVGAGTGVPISSTLAGDTNEATRSLSHTHTGAPHTHDLSNHTHSVAGHYHEHNTSLGSSLSISVSSGSHATEVSFPANSEYATINQVGFNGRHGHGTNYTTKPNELSVYDYRNNNGIWISTEDPRSVNMNVPGTIFNQELTTNLLASHTHTMDHSHKLSNLGAAKFTYEKPVLSSDEHLYFNRVSTDTWSAGAKFDIEPDPSGMNVTLSTSKDPLTTGMGLIGRTMTILEGSNSDLNSIMTSAVHTTAGTAQTNSYSKTAHKHFIKIILPNDDSTAEHQHKIALTGVKLQDSELSTSPTHRSLHTHTSDKFSGSIGNVNSGVNGNNSITSGTPNNNSTGAATYTGNSGTSVSPYLAVKFIIKATQTALTTV